MNYGKGTLSGFRRNICALFCVMKKKKSFGKGHVYVVQRCAKEWEPAVLTAENYIWYFVGERKLMLHQKSFSRFRIFILHLKVWKKYAEFYE